MDLMNEEAMTYVVCRTIIQECKRDEIIKV